MSNKNYKASRRKHGRKPCELGFGDNYNTENITQK